jgi:hypothetical protein
MARFRHPLKLKDVTKENMESLIQTNKTHKNVSVILGVSQGCVTRFCKRMSIAPIGRSLSNKLKGKAHSEKMKKLFSEGQIIPY